MFEKSILEIGGTRRQRTSTAFALLVEIVVVGTLMAIPLLYVEQLPAPRLDSPLVLAPPPLAPPTAHRSAATHQVARQSAVKAPNPRKFEVRESPPVNVPARAPLIAEAFPLLSDGVIAGSIPGGVPGTGAEGVIGGISGVAGPAASAPKPVAPEPAAVPQRIQVGGAVEAARLLREVQPRYPVLAREARIDGTVEMKAIIAPNGSVEQLSVISGHPLLVPAALAAVKQWVYAPAYLNGRPVEVATEIDVHFTLAG
jgi:periplasmic protein TonB